jgi:hypothetical protein
MELYASRRLHDEMDRRCRLFAIPRKPMPAAAEIARSKAHRRCPVVKTTWQQVVGCYRAQSAYVQLESQYSSRVTS